MTVYNENPVEVAREFAAAGAEMIHVVDLDGAFKEAESPNRAVVKRSLKLSMCRLNLVAGFDRLKMCSSFATRVWRVSCWERWRRKSPGSC